MPDLPQARGLKISTIVHGAVCMALALFGPGAMTACAENGQ